MSMKVGNVGSSKGVDKARKTQRTEGTTSGSFTDVLKETSAPEGAATVHESQGVQGVESILGLQEVGDATSGASRGKAVAYGNDLLDRLEQFRLAILQGTISKDRLQELAHRLRQRRQSLDDPRLEEVLQEIELRCEVEVAKLTRRG